MTNTFKTSQQSGRSMIEMLGVLAIVGVLSIGGVAGYSKAMAKYKINKTLDQVSLLITNIRTLYGNQVSYVGLNNANAVAFEIVGNDLSLGTTSTLTNPFSGTVTIEAMKQPDTTSSEAEACGTETFCPAFKITYTNLDRQSCATIGSADWGATASSGLVGIGIGKDEATAKYHHWRGTTADTELPINYNQAFKDCEDLKANIIYWVYN